MPPSDPLIPFFSPTARFPQPAADETVRSSVLAREHCDAGSDLRSFALPQTCFPSLIDDHPVLAVLDSFGVLQALHRLNLRVFLFFFPRPTSNAFHRVGPALRYVIGDHHEPSQRLRAGVGASGLIFSPIHSHEQPWIRPR